MNISACQTCYNCGLCYNICPHGAIEVNGTGVFYAPTIDAQKCTDCGLCYNRCPVNNVFSPISPIAAYAGWHKDQDILHSSSSGGVFWGLGKAIMDQGGTVFSAVYTNDCREVVFESTEDTDLAQMQKSKYVESLIGSSFLKIKTLLEQGKAILFCGTPCQCAGLRSFLDKEYDNLIVCDFACGGLPSHRIYQDYLSELQSRYEANLLSIDFRPKTHGWRRYAVLATFANKKKYNRLGNEDPYLHSFLYGKNTVRDSCLECKFSNCHQSDITIADFWLNGKYSFEENPDGISLVLCNTEKGKCAIEHISPHYHFEELDVTQVAYNNKETITSSTDKARHDAFIQQYEENGFLYAYKRFYPFSPIKAFKRWLCRVMRRRK